MLGFDRSEIRLEKFQAKAGDLTNCKVVRADADDLWRQLSEANLTPEHHFILFPNPYPKASQLNKRWHGSAAFPSLLKLGRTLELRSNWKTYLDEFSLALKLAINLDVTVERYIADKPITAFETEYQQAGQPLWRLQARLD